MIPGFVRRQCGCFLGRYKRCGVPGIGLNRYVILNRTILLALFNERGYENAKSFASLLLAYSAL